MDDGGRFKIAKRKVRACRRLDGAGELPLGVPCGVLNAPKGIVWTTGWVVDSSEMADMASVLVVDDLAADRRLMGYYLEPLGDVSVDYASDGKEALAKIEVAVPDVVITDLQMPDLDGLGLVQQIRDKYSELPVVLVTAHGSEEIAHDALEQGAASYVPKEVMAERLLPTVQGVLALRHGQRHDPRLMQCVRRHEIEYEIENDPTLIPPLVDEVMGHLSDIARCDATRRIRVGVALQEALSNALYHGNLEISKSGSTIGASRVVGGKNISLAEVRRTTKPYCDRRVRLTVTLSPSDAKFVVGDDGTGFDPALIPRLSAPERISGPGGRGLVLMQAFMDKVRYNAQGNVVTMWVQIKSQPQPVVSDGAPPAASGLFETEREGDTLIIVPTGNLMSLTEETAQKELMDILDAWANDGMKNIVIDFGRVFHFGSTMLTAMSVLREQVASRSGNVAVCNLSHVAKEVFDIAKFSDIWQICSTRRSALKAVKKK